MCTCEFSRHICRWSRWRPGTCSHRIFTHRRFYQQKLLHTEPFPQIQVKLYTEELLHKEIFSQRSFYTQTLLHRDALAHRRLRSRLTERFLYTAFAQRNLHTEKLLRTHTGAFTYKSFYAQNFYTDPVAHGRFYAVELLHRRACTQNKFGTQKL